MELNSSLAHYESLLRAWPGLLSRGEAESGHPLVEDAFVLLEFLGDVRTVIDVGTGGGIPGIPLKLARPQLALTLLESNSDKAAFLVNACAELHLDGVEVVARRAEEAGRHPDMREMFDLAVARALAPMPVLAELTLPFVKVGGRLLAQKTSGEDVSPALHAIELLGGKLVAVHGAPSAARIQGTVVEILKVVPTPAAYPRRAGIPNRKPL